jgi:hypothetical protein
MVPADERSLKESEALNDLIGGIDKERCAVAPGKGLERDLTAIEGCALLRADERARQRGK